MGTATDADLRLGRGACRLFGFGAVVSCVGRGEGSTAGAAVSAVGARLLPSRRPDFRCDFLELERFRSESVRGDPKNLRTILLRGGFSCW
jgi:hypothetical protein